MPGLYLHVGNRLEVLANRLADLVRLPARPPMAPEIILVQSRGMERWISMSLAERNKICGNCAFPFPNSFLHDIFRKLIPDLPPVEETDFDPGVMTFRVMDILSEFVRRPSFRSLDAYLRSDTGDLKRFQLSRKIADTFDQYLVFRPEIIFSWESGEERHWQAELWRELVRRGGGFHRARLRRRLLARLEDPRAELADLPERISVFGISYLPQFHLEAIAALSSRIGVHLFLTSPCREYWSDIVTRREIKKIAKPYDDSGQPRESLHLEEGNRLLAALGLLGRDFYNRIQAFEAETEELYDSGKTGSLLSAVQTDILDLRNRKIDAVSETPDPEPDGTIQIHSCHSPLREIEALHDTLLARFEADPDLLPKDVLVMTPDIESYAPFIHAVFDVRGREGVQIPYSVSDRSLRRESRVAEGFLALLELKESRYTVTEILGILDLPEVQQRFGFAPEEPEIIERWVRELRIRWGRDGRDRGKIGMPDFSENTWQAGIDRLLLGYAMPGEDRHTFGGILPYDPVEGGETRAIGKFLDFLDAVFETASTLDDARPASEWSRFFIDLLERFVLPLEEGEREYRMVRACAEELERKAAIAGSREPLDFEAVRDWMVARLEKQQIGSGFISGGVTFCAMLPMRSIPFRVVCLVGMNDGAFPRDDRPLGFDLMARDPRPGDRSRRNDDKYLFLEALLSARDTLYVSYVGQSIQDNSVIPPSVLVSELIDYLRDDIRIEPSRIVTRHRLQAFSPEYFKETSDLFSYSGANLSAAAALSEPTAPAPFIRGALPFAPGDRETWHTVDVETLCRFFGHPVRFFLQERLGVYLEEIGPVREDEENFSLDGLEQFLIGQELVGHRLSGWDPVDLLQIERSRGRLPHGHPGTIAFHRLSIETDLFVKKIRREKIGAAVDDFPIDVTLGDLRVVGVLDGLCEGGRFKTRFGRTRPADLLEIWIGHLLLCHVSRENLPETSHLVCRDKIWKLRPVKSPRPVLVSLAKRFLEGATFPLRFFPVASHEYAEQRLRRGRSENGALSRAVKKWRGSEFSPIPSEADDAYIELCFRGSDPFDDPFRALSEEIYRPLFKHLSEVV